jgi:transmembrane sensor
MENHIRKYLNGTANPQEFSAVLEELCSEDSLKEENLELLKWWEETLTTAVENRKNSQLLDKIHHRIALEESKKTARQLTLYRNLLKVAAILITGLLVSSILLYQPRKQQEFIPVTETVSTPYGARTSFLLPDGSEVWLNSGSSVSFPRQYGAIRRVDLKGEAYFKVIKNGKPFVVTTSYGNVEVMGTTFDVKAYQNEDLETTLVDGVVKVSDCASQMHTLNPGQQSVLTTDKIFTISNVNTELVTSWKDGKLTFVKEPFAKVVRELERWYNVSIELQGERLKKLCYTGTIEMETFGEVLELLNVTTPIKYQYNKNTRVLKISGR